jgi:Leucine-rich repeat (LRR) protein
LENLVNLKTLKLSQNKIITINEISFLKRLEYLILDYNQIIDISEYIFPRSLKYLYIAENPLNKTSIKKCEKLNSHNLKILY